MFTWFDDFVNLFYPCVCAACNNGLFKGENILCTPCLYQLPQTRFHVKEGNVVEKQFWGKVPVHSATALYYFTKSGKVQHLIHRLKYHGDKEVGVLAGNILGSHLRKSERFNTIDAIVPVPLHVKKLRARGFNQSDFFGLGLSESMKAPFYPHYLIRNKATSTQTRKSRFARFENVDRVFEVNPKAMVSASHFLLIDDVITTGSTLTSCAEALLEIPGTKVSIATIAYARM